jgi:mono/diheme cytochrome c family protein
MIVHRGLTPPPSFHVPRLINAPDSHFYNVITYGYGAMYGYAERVGPEERWEIIAYIRALQAAGREAGPEERAALIALGDREATPVREKGGGQ